MNEILIKTSYKDGQWIFKWYNVDFGLSYNQIGSEGKRFNCLEYFTKKVLDAMEIYQLSYYPDLINEVLGFMEKGEEVPFKYDPADSEAFIMRNLL